MSTRRALAFISLVGIFATGTFAFAPKVLALFPTRTPAPAPSYNPDEVGYLYGSDPDVILYKDSNGGGMSMGINAETGEGIPNIGFSDGRGGGYETTFNDQVSSIKIVRGEWQFFENEGYEGHTTGRLAPGIYPYELGHNNDRITSAIRVAP